MTTPASKPTLDIAHLQQWVGRTQTDHDVAHLRHAQLMAATIDRAPLQVGDALPPLWHWIYFLEGRRPAELGRDGHPARGGFLPPVPLPNRMWAGGRVDFLQAVPLGAPLRKRSTVQSVTHKQGQSGDLVFVTVRHEVFVEDGPTCDCAIREEHDIVYKNASPSNAGAERAKTAIKIIANDATEAPSTTAVQERTVTPTSTTLFRYSALTFNGHRIHYDADYCRDVEGYANLVIHGPLVATLLADWAQHTAARPLRHFAYRALNPALLGTALRLTAQRAEEGERIDLACTLDDGRVSMSATALYW